MKRILTVLLTLFSMHVFAQADEGYWSEWNKTYPLADISEVLKQEKHFADSVEKSPGTPAYYVRTDTYRFNAEYLGQIRPLDKVASASMSLACKLLGGDSGRLKNLTRYEVLFKVGNEEIWMPIQSGLLKNLKEGAAKGDRFTLYCYHFNEHTDRNELYNTFLISEFNKETGSQVSLTK